MDEKKATEVKANETAETVKPGEAFLRLLALFGVGNKLFWIGILLVSILNVIPILPTRHRTTGNILNRVFAAMLFIPLSFLFMVFFPLLFIEGWARSMKTMSDKLIDWFNYEDLNRYGL